MDNTNLWRNLDFIIEKYKYLLNISKNNKLSPKIAFECLECLKNFDDLESYYIGLNNMNIVFEEKFNDKEINNFIMKIRDLLRDCILNKAVFSPEEIIKYFQIQGFDKTNFLFIMNPFTEKQLKIKTHLYVFALHYFPIKKIFNEIDTFRSDCVEKYFLKEQLNGLLVKFSHYLSLIEMMIANQIKIEKIFDKLELSKLNEYELYIKENSDKESETNLDKLVTLQQLLNNISVELLKKIGITPDANTLNSLKNKIPNKLHLLSYNLFSFLEEYDNFYDCSYSVISHSINYWRDFTDKLEWEDFDINDEKQGENLCLDIEKQNPETLYSFTPRVFDESNNLTENYN